MLRRCPHQLPYSIFPAVKGELTAKKEAKTYNLCQAWPNAVPKFLQGIVTFPLACPSTMTLGPQGLDSAMAPTDGSGPA